LFLGSHKFIQLLQKVQNETEVTIEMLVCGRPTNKTKKINIESNLRLKSIHERIIFNENYDKLEYLRAIAHNLNL